MASSLQFATDRIYKEDFTMPKGKVLHSLKDLDQLNLVPVPELPEVNLGDLAALEAQADRISEAATQTQIWVRSTLGQISEVEKARREVREMVADKVREAQQKLSSLLNHEIPAYRRAAWLGLLGHEFSRGLNSKPEVEDLLNRLVQNGRLEEDPSGPLQAYHKAYVVSANACFGKSEKEEVRKGLDTLLSRVFQETGKTWKEKTQELRTQGSSDLNALLDGKPGKYAVEVPAEKVNQNGQIFWRGGGTLLVEVNEQGEILPLDSSGSIEEAIEEVKALGIFLMAYTLKWDKPPFVQGFDPERVKKLHLLWYLLKRAIRHKEEAERIAKLKEKLAKKTSVSPKEFFLDHKPGICLAEFQGAWQNLDGSAGPNNFFFLVERKEEQETEIRIRVVDASNLNGFFSSCMDEYTQEDDKFKGTAQPLRAVLMAIFGQVLETSQDANKASQIATER